MRAAHVLRLVFLSFLALACTSCIEDDETITLNADGSGRFKMDVVVHTRMMKAVRQMSMAKRSDTAPLLTHGAALREMVRSGAGIESWTQLSSDSSANGDWHLQLAGYFKDITKLRLPNSLLPARDLAGGDTSMTRISEMGTPIWKRQRGGAVLFEYASDRSGRDSLAAIPSILSHPPTPAEQEAIEEHRGMFSMVANLFKPMVEKGRIRRTYELPGRAKVSGVWSAPTERSVRLELDFSRALANFAEGVSSDTLARLMTQSVRSATNDSLKLGSSDQVVFEDLANELVFGRRGDPSALIEQPADQFDYKAERRAAVAAAPAGVAAVLAAAAAPDAGAPTSVRAKERVFPAFGFAFTPPEGWELLDPDASDSSPTLTLRKGRMYAAVAPETLGAGTALTLDALQAAVYANLDKAGTSESIGSEDFLHQGLTFRRLRSLQRPKGSDQTLAMVHVFGTVPGRVWQLAAWGPRADSTAVLAAAAELLAGLRLLDTTRALAGRPPGDADRPEWGYAVRSQGPGWRTPRDMSKYNALFDLFWLHAEDAAILIAPVRFDRTSPDLPALQRGLLSVMDMTEKDVSILPRAPWPNALGEGSELQAERTVQGSTYRYVIRIARGKRSGIMLVGYHAKTGGDRAAVMRALDAIRLKEPSGPAPALDREQLDAFSVVTNEIALSYAFRKQFAEALPWNRIAAAADSADGTLHLNVAHTLDKLDRAREARAYLEPLAGRFPEHAQLQLKLAQLQRDTGDTLAAAASFLRSVDAGLDDPEDLLGWMQSLVLGEHTALALEAARRWNGLRPDARTRRYEAEAVRESGDTTLALAQLASLSREYPGDEDIAYSIAKTLNTAGRYREADSVASAHLQNTPGHIGLLRQLGWSHVGRRWYREAKAAFARALELDADDEEAKTGLRVAADALGQGANTQIATGIAAVELPPEITEMAGRALPESLTAGAASVIVLNATGHAFEHGRPDRRTIHLRTRVFTAAGADQAGTIEIPFQPSRERIGINRVAVIDDHGSAPVLSSADDAYVIDQQHEVPNGAKTLHIQVRGVRPGSTVEATVTLEALTADSTVEMQRELLSSSLPEFVSALYVTGDTSRVRSVLRNSAGVRLIRRRGLAAWVAQPAYRDHREPYSKEIEERAPIITFGGTERSWDAVGRHYLADIAPLLEADAEVTALARKLVAGASNDRERAARIIRHVQHETQYRAVAFGRRARRPLPAAQVLAAHSGDCKDMAVLLHLLLRAAGIPSTLALVNASWRIEPDLPTLDQFDHMIVRVPALGEQWDVDVTDKSLQLDAFPARGLGHSHVLLLDPAGPRLVPAAPVPPNAFVVHHRCSAELRGADWVVQDTLRLEAYAAAGYRSWLVPMTPADRAGALQQFLDPAGSLQIQDLRADALDEPLGPLTLTWTSVLPAAVESQDGKPMARLPVVVEKRTLVMPYLEERHNDIRLDEDLALDAHYRVKLPAALAGRGAFSPAQAEQGLTRWAVRFPETARANELAMTFEFRASKGELPAASYAALRESWMAPLARMSQPVRW